MPRRAFAGLSVLLLIAACQTDQPTGPTSGPNLAISDGAHSAGNADFFFLPPFVLPTTSYANFTSGGANMMLLPTLEVCPLNASLPSQVNPGTACLTPAVPIVPVKKHIPTGPEPPSLPGVLDAISFYYTEYKLPNPCAPFYRFRVKVGSTELGFADLQCVPNLFALLKVDFKNFAGGIRGTKTLNPFRIERYALCAVPGVGPCSSTQADLNLTPVILALPPAPDDPPGSAPSVLNIPIQPPELPLPPTVITIQDCPDFNNRATDLPTFGRCMRITADPELPPAGLAAAATVAVCNLGSSLPSGMSHNQSHRITIHRLDAAGETQTLTALPHAPGCLQFTTDASSSLKGLVRELAHGRWKAAGRQLAGLFSPAPLYARRLDEGAGGFTSDFSDFQAVLPGKIGKVAATDNQIAEVGSTLPIDPQVLVTDLGNEAIMGARVRFAADVATCQGLAPGSGTPTDAFGHASAPWTISGTLGENSRVACGRGLAGDDNNGPRLGVDPFMPFPYTGPPIPEVGTPSGAVVVLTGSVTFHASGEIGFESGIPAAWTSFGTTGASLAVPNLSPTQGTKFAFMQTPGTTTTSFGGTGGSTLQSDAFAASAGDILGLDFNFLTNDGTTGFRDFAYVQLLNSSNAVVATVANANTTGAVDQAVPAFGSSPPSPPDISSGVLLSPLTAIFDGVSTGPLGVVTYGPGKYPNAGGEKGGSTGFVHSTFTIPANDTYKLLFVVMDFGNRAFSSALVIDKISLQRP